ncbi:hypothetical protein GWK08_07035 [Leptobacterium flavescens]|uniref:Uncharacterized protein n=1 Tax=Leptobacterium flavescens TaxID=472055 RepID=A0A6P0UJM8_9FLAO|nr:hypothetical protein [Leptobacterium flavescens]NER13187.1 hypothetical protein [Leptobacterium flavescens]
MRTKLYPKPTRLNIKVNRVEDQIDSFTDGINSTLLFMKNLLVITRKVFML